jgi:hypothetical protein
MVVADTKAADSGGLEKRRKKRSLPIPPWHKPYKPQTHTPNNINKI